MKLIVKTFLENNIELIDSCQWERLFYKWYALAGDDIDPWEQNEIEKQLFDVLAQIDISMSITEKDHKKVIRTCLEGSIQDILYAQADRGAPYDIKWNTLAGELNSWIGFDIEDVYKILEDIAKTENLNYHLVKKKYIINA